MKKTHRHLYAIVLTVIIAVTVLLNVLAWHSTGLCDWYCSYVFPITLSVWGRFCGLFPFSVGDLLLVLTAVWGLVCVGACIVSAFFRGKIWIITKKYLKFSAVYVCAILLILTTNWWMLYHTSELNSGASGGNKEFTAAELVEVYNYVVTELNELCLTVPRTQDGIPYCDIDINEEGIALMQALKDTYPRLAGFYPNPKKMMFSDFFSQQYISGYYFPVTLEANINTRMMEINFPFVTCHELAHLKGFIREDEANFIAFLACTGSDNTFFRYSGYLGIVNFLENNIKEYSQNNGYFLVERNPITYTDNIFLSREAWEEVESTAILDTEIVETVSDVLVDTSLKLNGVGDGKISYSRVVELILYYYEGKLYE